MAYCPECGNEVGDQANFCMECGEALNSEPAKEAKNKAVTSLDKNNSRTISFTSENDDEKLINADNITYLEVTEVEPTEFLDSIAGGGFRSAVIVAGIIALLSLLSGSLEGAVIAIINGFIFGFIIMTGIYASYDVPQEHMELGTLNNKYSLEQETVDDVEQQFRDASSNLLTVDSTHKSRVRIWKFRYHFIPDNVVSITYNEGSSASPSSLFAIFIGGSVGSYKKPDQLIVDFQNEESKEFRLSTEDRKQIISEFDTRRQGQQRVRADSIQTDEQ